MFLYFWAKVVCTILYPWNTRHPHIHNTRNPEIPLKTKCQSNFSSWGSAVMASDKANQAWYIFKTSDLSWQPSAILALLLWASLDRRTQASLGSFQSYTTRSFPGLYPSWSCQYFLFAPFANLRLVCAWFEPCPASLPIPQKFSLVTRTPQALLLFQLLLTTVVSALTPCPSLCKSICDTTQAKLILI